VGGRRGHPIFARMFVRASAAMDAGGGAEHRQRLLAGLEGRIVEVGAGNGRNFAHYPPGVTGVLAVEPERYLRELAAHDAALAPVSVEVVEGVAERLPADDGAFDAGVVSLVLCSVADQAAALRELRRVIRPGGELRFYEHVRAETPGLRRVQRVLDRTVWPFFVGGCHTGRDTAGAIEATGFRIERLDRFRFPEGGLPTPTAPHVLGVATRT
jgi:ubiquinone/menaquinone biosynthesis C-methylase UbiE